MGKCHSLLTIPYEDPKEEIEDKVREWSKQDIIKRRNKINPSTKDKPTYLKYKININDCDMTSPRLSMFNSQTLSVSNSSEKLNITPRINYSPRYIAPPNTPVTPKNG